MLDFEVFYSYFLVGFRLFRGFLFFPKKRDMSGRMRFQVFLDTESER